MKKSKATKLFERAQKELKNEKAFRMWLVFVYGYMEGSMNDVALESFEKQIGVMKKIFNDS